MVRGVHEEGAVRARRVRDLAEVLARGAVDDLDAVAARHEHAAGRAVGGEVVEVSRAADVELGGRELLGARDGGSGEQSGRDGEGRACEKAMHCGLYEVGSGERGPADPFAGTSIVSGGS